MEEQIPIKKFTGEKDVDSRLKILVKLIRYLFSGNQ